MNTAASIATLCLLVAMAVLPGPASVDVYVGYLRRKLEERGEPRLLHTVRGVGYQLRMPPDPASR